MLRLIKLWLKAPIEERDGDGKRRRVGGKRNKRGTPQGGVATPRTQKINPSARMYLYMSVSPSKKSVQQLKTKVRELLKPGNNDPWPEVRDHLNRSLRG